MSTVQKAIYNVFFKSTPVYATFVLGGAFALEQAIDRGIDNLWAYKNQGKLWEHVQAKLDEQGLLNTNG